jgi:multidrug efflux pump subunit AcrB
VLALIGILIRNSVILIVQIEDLIATGTDRLARGDRGDGAPHAADRLLTAAAASLALIPIAREVFWAPMAYAMMGGIMAGTAITLLFLPALYVAWFRLKEPNEQAPAPQPMEAPAI